MTEPESNSHMTTGNWIFVVAAALLGVINLIDFAFYGHDFRDLGAAVGLLFIAWGGYKDITMVMVGGALLAIGSVAAKYLL